MKDTRTFDISLRLPEDKKYLKKELVKVEKKNHLTLTNLMIYVIEWFLEERKDQEFTIKLRQNCHRFCNALLKY
jgi:hypothetical protein